MKLEGTKQFIEYEKRKQEDQEKMKKLKEKDLPSAIALINKQNNPILKPKTKLIMPAPQLHDKDLELLGKLNSQVPMSDTDNVATKALIGNYTIREATTSVMRTPRQMDSILIQAQNAAAQRNIQTPLMGGSNVQLLDEKLNKQGTILVPNTPNQFSELLAQAQQTPNLRKGTVQQNSILRPSQKMMTPMHDQFKINQDEIMDSNWEQSGQQLLAEKLEKLKQEQLKQSIKTSLKNLPKPKQDYLIEIPEIENNKNNKMEEEILDAEDQERIKAKQMRQESEKRQKNQLLIKSLVIQKNLPRPYKIPDSIYRHITENDNVSFPRKIIEEILNNEIQQMLEYDSIQNPQQGIKPSEDFNIADYELFEREELSQAEGYIFDEINNIKQILKQDHIPIKNLQEAWIKNYQNLTKNYQNNTFYSILTSKSFISFEPLVDLPQEQKLKNLQNKFELMKQFYVKSLAQTNAQEKKLRILLQGYAKRSLTLSKEIQEKYQNLDQYEMQNCVYNQLKDNENIALNIRLNEAKQYHKSLVGKENELQHFQKKKYQNIIQLMKELHSEEGLFQNL